MKDYDIVIGLEIHAELKTNTKVFCSCKNAFGSEPNTNVCPVCIGLPGTLPVINKRAVELTVKAGLCMGCDISPVAVFERKNYFYPDLCKAYQISQLQKPICIGGGIQLDSGKFIRLNRIHLEEDAGKLIHVNSAVGTLIDYNRGGVPLIEIVTEPDISSAEEAVEFMTKLRSNLVFGQIADCRMEQGGMRCDVNLSIKPKGSAKFGTRTEMKNLNSFKMVHRAITYEAQRQMEVLEEGGVIKQQTRKWDDNRNKSFTMRSKEEAQDYRYFPDPDILSVAIGQDIVEGIRKEIPRLAKERQEYYVSALGLPEYDSKILTSEYYISQYFEECLKGYNNPKVVSNWVMTEVLRKLKEKPSEDLNDVITSSNLIDIMAMVEDKTITRVNAKELFELVAFSDKDAKKTAKEQGMIVEFDADALTKTIEEVFAYNAKAVPDYKAEPEKVMNFFIGQTMRATKGTAKVDFIKPIIIKKLEELNK